MKKYSFFFHYNKPASLKFGSNKLSIHFKDTCYIVDGIKCDVAIQSRNKKTQPRCVMSGKATELTLLKNDSMVIGHLS